MPKAKKDPGFWVVGEKYFIRTVTHYHVGRLAAISDAEIVLEDASWVAETDRFHDTLKTGALNEVEPFCGPVCIGRGSLVDATVWPHELPKDQK